MRHSVLAPIVLLLSACMGHYLGIERAELAPEAQASLDRAQAGDKRSQYELGRRFATGDGVGRDCEAARKLLEQAARDTGGTIWVYQPPVAKGATGRVVPVDMGPRQAGLPEARQALASAATCPEWP